MCRFLVPFVGAVVTCLSFLRFRVVRCVLCGVTLWKILVRGVQDMCASLATRMFAVRFRRMPTIIVLA